MTALGPFKISYWCKLSKTGHSGWIVTKDRPEGGLGELFSKHKTKKAAVAEARRLTEEETSNLKRA